jgi:hypothetical protein
MVPFDYLKAFDNGHIPPPYKRNPRVMTYQRFKELWNALVVNRAPSQSHAAFPNSSDNGVSKRTVAGLVAAADGDFKYFDDILGQLDKRTPAKK